MGNTANQKQEEPILNYDTRLNDASKLLWNHKQVLSEDEFDRLLKLEAKALLGKNADVNIFYDAIKHTIYVLKHKL